MIESLIPAFRSDVFSWLALAFGLAPVDGRVVAGPFSGMSYARKRPYYPLLLGTYESELKDVIEEICRTPFDTAIDVGGAEGYYIVGLARRMPKTKVIAFELDPGFQQLARELAAANGVSNQVEVLGLCDGPALTRSLANSNRSLVVMDIEGSEAILLDPAVAPGLKDATILVELHDDVYAGMGDLITERFARTHTIAEIWSQERTLADFPLPLTDLKKRVFGSLLLFMMWERRGRKMRWYYLKPRPPNLA